VKITLQKYILTEMLPVFVSSLVVFGFIMLGTRMLSITELVVNQGVSAGQVIRLVFFLIPGIIFFALPAASLMASLLAFIRLSSDNEIIALKSSGISLYQVLPPVLLLAFGAFLVAGVTAFAGLPWGNRAMKDMVLEIAESRADVGLKERVFCQPFDDVIFYISDLEEGNHIMRDVFVVDKREPDMIYTIIAKEGQILLQPQARAIVVRFVHGSIFMEQRGRGPVKTMEFRNYDLKVGLEDIMESLASEGKAPKEMSAGEMLDLLEGLPWNSKKRNEILVELLERVTLPVAVFFLCVIGVPLGTHMRARTFSFGIGAGMGVFLVYYMIFMATRSLCETGELSPLIGMWLPNLFLLVSSIYLFRRVADEKLLPFAWEGPFMRWVRAWGGGPSGRGGCAAAMDGPASLHETPTDRDCGCPAEWVGNIRQGRFHLPGCRCVEALAQDNRRTFQSRDEALQAGYEPCKVCRP